MGNERLLRLYLLDRYLSETLTPKTAEEILDYLTHAGELREISKRTLYEDLRFLETFPGGAVGLKITNEKPRRYRIEYGESLFRRPLRQNEAHLLRELLDIVGSFDGLERIGAGGELDSMYKAVRLSAPTRRIVDTGIRPHENKNLFARLYKAIADRMVISLRYRPMAEIDTDSEVRILEFRPYRLKHHDGRWVVLGAADNDGFICKFYFDQIAGFEPVRDTRGIVRHYTLMEAEGVAHHFDDAVGLSVPQASCSGKSIAPVEVIVAALPPLCNHVASFPLHPSQDELDSDSPLAGELRAEFPELPDNVRFFFFTAYDTPELHRALIARTNALIVLRPASVRMSVADSLQRLASLYSR